MLKTQTKVAGIFCLNPKVEAFYTLTHHLLYNKTFPEKYEYLWKSLPNWRHREYLDFRSYPLIFMYCLLSFYKFKNNNILSNMLITRFHVVCVKSYRSNFKSCFIAEEDES